MSAHYYQSIRGHKVKIPRYVVDNDVDDDNLIIMNDKEKKMNKVMLLGNVGQEVDLRTTANGVTVCNLRIATDRKYKHNNEWKTKTTWHNVVVFGKTAEACSKYVTKGQKVVVEGYIDYKNFKGKDGQEKSATDIIAENVHFLRGTNAGEKAEEDYKAPPLIETPDDIPF